MSASKWGTIFPESSMFLRKAVGTAESQGGQKYELTTSVPRGSPIVRSEKTGKYWTISWDELITLARTSGIDRSSK